MAKGQGFGEQKQNPIAVAAELLHTAASRVGKPIVIPMLPPGNERGLGPGQISPGQPELPPSCDGVVLAVHCSANDAQELVDLVMNWQKAKEDDR